MAEENKIVLEVDVKPLKKQLREAQQELQLARQQFGEYSDEATKAAQKVAGLKDEIESANEASQVFDPGKRFQALTTAASTAAAGIAAGVAAGVAAADLGAFAALGAAVAGAVGVAAGADLTGADLAARLGAAALTGVSATTGATAGAAAT